MNTTATTVKRKKRQTISKGIERICSHVIEWYLEGKGLRLSDTDIEHIQNSLIDNYIEGELCTITPDDNIANGWWSIQW
jgi:hypothetical protein